MTSRMHQIRPTYVIGDVHGCYHTLVALLERLPYNAEIIFVGDLCDKGHYSKEVIELVMEHGYRCVKGNHEFLMEKYLRDAVVEGIHSPWSEDYRYGGIETYEAYRNDREMMERHLAWIASLPRYIQHGNYFITHGYGLPFYAQKDDPSIQDELLLNRYEIGAETPSPPVINIFGHCGFDEVVAAPSLFCIDTSCSYGKTLTAFELGTHRVIQEPMDSRDSSYEIKALQIRHLSPDFHYAGALPMLIHHIDTLYEGFDLVSTEVAELIVRRYGIFGLKEIEKMLEKKQLFMKQAKKVIEKYGKISHIYQAVEVAV